jgi:formylglycine-generating enzyme required for sulfatase activity
MSITLPTEQQWQRAAQGDDHRIYPWGDDWDCHRCNNSVSPCKSQSTTPVTQYEGRDKGNSPYDVVDMAGNVWEWCLTDFIEGDNDINRSDVRGRVLRGGSWYFNSNVLRAAIRSRNTPDITDYGLGFRCARS